MHYDNDQYEYYFHDDKRASIDPLAFDVSSDLLLQSV